MLFNHPDCQTLQKCPVPWRHLHCTQSNPRLPGPTRLSIQTASLSVQPSLYISQQRVLIFSLYFTMGRHFSPSKLTFCMGRSGPHQTHSSLGLPETTSRTASQSLQPLLQGSRSWPTDRRRPTDRRTDRPRYSVCSNRPHLPSSAMRPNNSETTAAVLSVCCII